MMGMMEMMMVMESDSSLVFTKAATVPTFPS